MLFPVLFLIWLSVSASKSEKLTKNENMKRLRTCGQQMLHVSTDNSLSIPLDKDSWLIRVSYQNDSSLASLGSFISPRHIITSSQSILTSDKTWVTDNKDISDTDYINGTDNVEVPESLTKLMFVEGGEGGPRYSVKKAWLLDVRQKNHFDRMFCPMIVEVDKNTDIKYACTPEKSTPLNPGDLVYTYGRDADSDSDKVMFRRKEVKSLDSDSRPSKWVVTDKEYTSGDRGGPLVKNISGKPFVMAIGASTGYQDPTADFNYHFSLKSLLKDICRLTGICPAPPIIPTYQTIANGTSETSESPESQESLESSDADEPEEELVSSWRSASHDHTKDEDDEDDEEKGELETSKDREDYDDNWKKLDTNWNNFALLAFPVILLI